MMSSPIAALLFVLVSLVVVDAAPSARPAFLLHAAKDKVGHHANFEDSRQTHLVWIDPQMEADLFKAEMDALAKHHDGDNAKIAAKFLVVQTILDMIKPPANEKVNLDNLQSYNPHAPIEIQEVVHPTGLEKSDKVNETEINKLFDSIETRVDGQIKGEFAKDDGAEEGIVKRRLFLQLLMKIMLHYLHFGLDHPIPAPKAKHPKHDDAVKIARYLNDVHALGFTFHTGAGPSPGPPPPPGGDKKP